MTYQQYKFQTRKNRRAFKKEAKKNNLKEDLQILENWDLHINKENLNKNKANSSITNK